MGMWMQAGNLGIDPFPLLLPQPSCMTLEALGTFVFPYPQYYCENKCAQKQLLLGTISSESHICAYRFMKVEPEIQSPELCGTGSSGVVVCYRESEPGSAIKCHLKQRR